MIRRAVVGGARVAARQCLEGVQPARQALHGRQLGHEAMDDQPSRKNRFWGQTSCAVTAEQHLSDTGRDQLGARAGRWAANHPSITGRAGQIGPRQRAVVWQRAAGAAVGGGGDPSSSERQQGCADSAFSEPVVATPLCKTITSGRSFAEGSARTNSRCVSSPPPRSYLVRANARLKLQKGSAERPLPSGVDAVRDPDRPR